MELILKSLARADSRIWIVDQQQRLLALAGDLKRSAPLEEGSGALALPIRLLRPVTSFVLEPPSNDFDDALPESEIAYGPVATSAIPIQQIAITMPEKRNRINAAELPKTSTSAITSSFRDISIFAGAGNISSSPNRRPRTRTPSRSATLRSETSAAKPRS